MVKVRSDIVAFTILMVLLVLLGNSFVHFERELYEDARKSSSDVGFPPSDSAIIVTTMDELEAAMENGDEFSIKVETDNITKTGYYKEQHTDNAPQKIPGFFVHLFTTLESKIYDRMYIVELEDGERVPVLMYGKVLDFSEDTMLLPIGEKVSFKKSREYLEKLDDKYGLSGDKATYWYIDAAGDQFTLDLEFREKQEQVYTTNILIMLACFILYCIISTVYLVKARKKYEEQVKAQGNALQ